MHLTTGGANQLLLETIVIEDLHKNWAIVISFFFTTKKTHTNKLVAYITNLYFY